MRRPFTTSIIAAFVLPLLFACKGDTEGQPDTAAVPAAPAATTAGSGPVLAALLEKADAADGATDRVVGKCVMCGLAMPGKAENAVEVSGYTVQLCGAGEVAKFQANPEASLKAALGG